VPWALLLQGSIVAHQRWHVLSEKERARLLALVKRSRGRPGNLTAHERDEVRRLVAKLDVTAAGRDLLPLVRRARRRSA
jgi:hypothetical protein